MRDIKLSGFAQPVPRLYSPDGEYCYQKPNIRRGREHHQFIKKICVEERNEVAKATINRLFPSWLV